MIIYKYAVTSLLQSVRRLPRKLNLLTRSLHQLLKDKDNLSGNLKKLQRAWHDGGLRSLKGALLGLSDGITPNSWSDHRNTFAHTVRPHILECIRNTGAPVTISIIVPTYNTPEPMLKAMLRSVQDQLYPNWELCIADDGSNQPHVAAVLQAFAQKDKRIKLHLGPTNHGVSHASNRALEMASGPFVVLLDHDDLLEEQAIFRVAESIAQDDPDMLYSDEVLVSPDGETVLQYFHRPTFSPEYLRSHPYIVHMVGFRTALVRALGGFDEQLKISQDYDLILRVSEQAQTIVHLPEILYQWRTHTSSAGHDRANEVMAASTAVLQRHLQRCGVEGTVGAGKSFNFFETRYPLQHGSRVAIIIPTKNHGDLVRQCIDSIHTTTNAAIYDIVVIDHESDDPETIAYLESIRPQVQVLRYAGPFNFSSINNWAVAQLGGQHTHYLFCNNDIEALEPGWLERMLELAAQPDVGIVGAQLLYPDRTSIQHAGVCVGAFGIAEHYGKFLRLPPDRVDISYMGRLIVTHEVAAVTAACLLMRRDAFEEINGFDETLAVGFGDVDLCLRTLALGWRVLYCPQATLLHHESYTRGKTVGYDPHPEDSAKFSARWKDFLQQGDPYFNPGLSLRHTCWQVQNPMLCHARIGRRLFKRSPATPRQELRHS